MADENEPAPRPDPEVLRDYRGRYVVIRNGAVSIAADTIAEAITQARKAGGTYDMMFKVPVDPTIDMSPEV